LNAFKAGIRFREFRPFSCNFYKACYSIGTMVVRMRSTRSHTGNRRSHHALKNPALTVDSKSGAIHLRHRASALTGAYKGLVVIDVDKKAKKKAAKAKEAQAAR